MSSPLILPKKGLRKELYAKRNRMVQTSRRPIILEKKRTFHNAFQDVDLLPEVEFHNVFLSSSSKSKD